MLKSPLNPDEKEINEHLARHGDGVKDVAFTVDDAKGIFQVGVILDMCFLLIYYIYNLYLFSKR